MTSQPELAAPPPESVKRSVSVLMASQLATWILALVMTFVQQRLLGPEGVGILGISTSVWAIAAIVIALGTGTSITLEVARNRDGGQRVLPGALVLRALAFVVGALLVAAFVWIAGYDRTTVLVIAIGGIGAAFVLQADVARAALYGMQRMSAVASTDIITKVTLVVGVLTVLYLGAGVKVVAVVIAATGMVSCALMWRSVRGSTSLDFSQPIAGAGRALRMGSPYLVSDAAHIVYLQVDVVAISLLTTETEVGWYSSANNLFASLLFVPTIFMTALFPRIAQMHDEGNDNVETMLHRTLRFMLFVGLPIGLGTMVVAEPVMVAISGEAFRKASDVLEIFGIVLIIEFFTIPLGRFAIATNRHRFFNTLIVIVTVASIPLDLWLVPWMHDRYGNGAIGGAIAYIITEMFIVVMSVAVIARTLLSWHWLWLIGRSLVAGAALIAAAWPLRDRFLAVPVVAGAVAYVAVAAALRLVNDDEKAMVQSLMHGLRRRAAA